MTETTRTEDGSVIHADRASRESLFLSAEIEIGGMILRGRVRNVSETGALVECVHECQIGDVVRVSFQGVHGLEARITRITQKGMGLRFATPIDPAVCRRSVSAPKTDWTKDYLLCLREGGRTPRWQTDEIAKRPKLR